MPSPTISHHHMVANTLGRKRTSKSYACGIRRPKSPPLKTYRQLPHMDSAARLWPASATLHILPSRPRPRSHLSPGVRITWTEDWLLRNQGSPRNPRPLPAARVLRSQWRTFSSMCQLVEERFDPTLMSSTRSSTWRGVMQFTAEGLASLARRPVRPPIRFPYKRKQA